MLNLPCKTVPPGIQTSLPCLPKGPTASPPTCGPHHELLRNNSGLAEKIELVNYISPNPLNLKYYAQVQTALAFHFSWL